MKISQIISLQSFWQVLEVFGKCFQRISRNQSQSLDTCSIYSVRIDYSLSTSIVIVRKLRDSGTFLVVIEIEGGAQTDSCDII